MTDASDNQGLFRDGQIRYVKLGDVYVRRFASGSQDYYNWRYISQEYFKEQQESKMNTPVSVPKELIADITAAKILGKIAKPIREYGQ